jgi:RNA polymerase sigma-70 factor (ECF subfamily)
VSSSAADEQRFEALYRAHFAEIARYAHRRTDSSSAEEVVAETFAIAWRRLNDVPEDPLRWLYGVAANVLRQRRRAATSRQQKDTWAAALLAQRSSQDPAEALAEREHVLEAFASLSETDREALALVAWEDLSHRDAAEALGMTRVAFSMRLSRARRRLTAALGPEHPPLAARSIVPAKESSP